MSDFVRKLPNWLTYIRLGLIPLFVLLLIEPSRLMVNFALVIFIIAAFTDYIDGMLARRYRAVSDFGKLLDPLADKILVMAALIMLVAQRSDDYGEPWVPGWLVVVILAREIWITGLRGMAANQGIVISASSSGKWKSAIQMVAIVLLLLHDYSLVIGGIRMTCQIIGINLLIVSVVLSLWSAAQYTRLVIWSGEPETSKAGEPSETHRTEDVFEAVDRYSGSQK